MNAPSKSSRSRSDLTLIAIGAFKLAKCALLLAFGVALIRYRDQDLGMLASNWMDRLWLGRPYFSQAIMNLSFLSQKTIDEFAVGAFVYSVLLAIEGVGLCLRRRWAEYLTVIITASLLPFEVYKLYHGVTFWGVSITVANLAILAYLVRQLITKESRAT